MDPTANLKEQREIIDRVDNHTYQSVAAYEVDMDRLCELVTALDEWISKGGFLPEQWRKKE